MRATIGTALRRPRLLSAWWDDLPARRRWWWRAVLFERGQGWLRWGTDKREAWEWESNAMAHYCAGEYEVAPPLRRLAIYAAWWPRSVRNMMFGHKFEDEPRFRLSWEELRPEWPAWLRDDERKSLWA